MGDRTDGRAIIHLALASDGGADAKHLVAHPFVELRDSVERVRDLG